MASEEENETERKGKEKREGRKIRQVAVALFNPSHTRWRLMDASGDNSAPSKGQK